MNSISIVIPTFNREKELNTCLENLLQNNISNIEIIVTNDNLLKDISVENSIKFPSVKFVSGPGKGPAANRNFGAKMASGNWLIFLDDDCIPQQNWLSNYIIEMDKNQADILEGKTIANREKQRYDEVSPINLFGGKLWSCNFAIRKDFFNELSGFDEHFPYSTMEDIDFKERAKMKADILFLSNCVVVHPWRRRIAFKNFYVRIKSQKYFAEKFKIRNTPKFKIQRLKIFISSIFSNFKELHQFKFKGWTCYFDKMLFNFFMLFI
ncbi:MAG: glycosyltransferase family 2 protein [Bacteroidia bacterium]